MKACKKAALILSAFVLTQPLLFADAQLNKEIAALEVELVKMETKVGDYAKMSEAKLEKQIAKTKKTLEKKKAKAKKELEKDTKNAKKDLKDAGKEIKNAGKDVGSAVKGFFD